MILIHHDLENDGVITIENVGVQSQIEKKTLLKGYTIFTLYTLAFSISTEV